MAFEASRPSVLLPHLATHDGKQSGVLVERFAGSRLSPGHVLCAEAHFVTKYESADIAGVVGQTTAVASIRHLLHDDPHPFDIDAADSRGHSKEQLHRVSGP
jgi:hypothetical protein